MVLGDMQVIGVPAPKLAKALAVIAAGLHPGFDAQPWISCAGKSKESCVLSSLAIRDFLFRVGFRDAEVRPVLAAIRAVADGSEVHSLGIGEERLAKKVPANGRWHGHMVAVVPSESYLVDATLYPADRPAWKGLPGMMAVPLVAPDGEFFGLKPLAGFERPLDDGLSSVQMLWLDQPTNRSWKSGPDAARRRRTTVVEAMVARFGDWHGS